MHASYKPIVPLILSIIAVKTRPLIHDTDLEKFTKSSGRKEGF